MQCDMQNFRRLGKINYSYIKSKFNYDYILGFYLSVRSFEVIWISDPKSLGSLWIKGTDESTLMRDSLVPLMHYDPDRS